MAQLEQITALLCDMDGVILKDHVLIPGAEKFIHNLLKKDFPFLFLTNYPSQTPAELQHRLKFAGIEVPESHFYTSAMATAAFLQNQTGRKAYVIGEGALTHELYKIGFSMTEYDPDFVIVGETRAYNWEMIRKASTLVTQGARFIATNPDVVGPDGVPSCGALCAPIERISRKSPFYVGKPNSWMMRAALNKLQAHSENTAIIGDNMNTDIIAGLQSGMETILVLTGVSQMDQLHLHPFRPNHIFPSIGEVDLF